MPGVVDAPVAVVGADIVVAALVVPVAAVSVSAAAAAAAALSVAVVVVAAAVGAFVALGDEETIAGPVVAVLPSQVA